jgi:hypothetical protein
VDSPSFDVLAFQNEANQRWVVQQHILDEAYKLGTPPDGAVLVLPAVLETKEQDA